MYLELIQVSPPRTFLPPSPRTARRRRVPDPRPGSCPRPSSPTSLRPSRPSVRSLPPRTDGMGRPGRTTVSPVVTTDDLYRGRSTCISRRRDRVRRAGPSRLVPLRSISLSLCPSVSVSDSPFSPLPSPSPSLLVLTPLRPFSPSLLLYVYLPTLVTFFSLSFMCLSLSCFSTLVRSGPYVSLSLDGRHWGS